MSEEQIKQYYERIEKLLNGANKETYGFVPEEIRQILRWYKHSQYIIDELEKWLEEKLKEMQLIIDDIDISFEVDYERIDEARSCKIAYNTVLDKLQELKGSE